MSKYKYYYFNSKCELKHLGDYDYTQHALEDEPVESCGLHELVDLKIMYNELKKLFGDNNESNIIQ